MLGSIALAIAARSLCDAAYSHIFCPPECGCPSDMMRDCEIMGAKSKEFVKKNVTLKNCIPEISSRMSVDKVDKRLLWPVLMGFFIMGFCDMVAPITGRIAAEFPASQQAAVSFLPTMVFLWFLLLSTPLAALMNRWGRKATAMVGYAFTVAGLLVPFAAGEGSALGWYFAGFGLLGIGNTAIQVAINPLLATIVPDERMTSYLTVGQIFRNTSLLLLAPIVTALVALTGSWRLLLPIYAGLTVLGGIWLQFTTVAEPRRSARSAGLSDCFRLLKNKTVLLCTLGVACFIAGDVGIGFLSVRLIDNPDSILTTTGFYACRIVGTLIGAWVLVRISDVKYLRWNMAGALLLCILLLFVRNEAAIYAAIGVLGFAMACVFATFYAVATKAVPENANEVAGLMIMAIAAGAVSGPVCGAIIRWTGNPHLGMLFVALCIGYMLWASFRLRIKN